jgi:zinc protease
MSSVRETEIDGVLCFFVDTGRPLSSAHLIFRQGAADEPLHETGWLHLLEHLALLDRETLSRPVTGSTSMLLTAFETNGPAEAIVQRLGALSGWLAEPDLRLLARERGVLQAEAQLRSDPLVRSLTWRYGAVGPGVASYVEAGSVRATPELLVERSRHVFNSSNAVLVLDGPPPAGLSLPLAPGEYHPPAPARAVGRPLPAAYVDDAGLTLSGAVPRTHEATFLPALLERAVHDGLRQRTGGVYAPWSGIVTVDDHRAVVAAGSDVVPEMLGTIVEAGLDISRGLATEGVPRLWLDEAIATRLQALARPEAAFAIALGAAYAVLSDRVPKSQEELVEELRITDPQLVDVAARAFHDSLLLGVPEGADLGKHIDPVAFPEVEPTPEASRHRHVNWPADLTTFAADAESIESATTHTARRLQTADVVCLLAWRDGTRRVVGRDGSVIEMEPQQWARGQELTAVLDTAVPAELHLPMPDRAVTFRRMGPTEICAVAFARAANTRQGLAAMLGFSLLLVLLGLLSGHPLVASVFVLVALALGMQLWLIDGRTLRIPWPKPRNEPSHAR